VPLIALLVALIPAAHADPWSGGVVARADEVPEVASYGRIDGEGPATARWRRRSGPYRVWTFEDGLVEHYERREEDALVDAAWFSAGGALAAKYAVVDEVATLQVSLERRVELDVSAWSDADLGGAVLTLPPGAAVEPGRAIAEGEDWRLVAVLDGPPVEPLARDFVDGLRSTCACTLLDAVAIWVDGRPGVRFLTSPLVVAAPTIAELFVVPTADHTLMVAFTAPAGAPAETRALGRAALALTHIPEPAP
jgi:hypothetical protein